jgi:hypothetical protein
MLAVVKEKADIDIKQILIVKRVNIRVIDFYDAMQQSFFFQIGRPIVF